MTRRGHSKKEDLRPPSEHSSRPSVKQLTATADLLPAGSLRLLRQAAAAPENVAAALIALSTSEEVEPLESRGLIATDDEGASVVAETGTATVVAVWLREFAPDTVTASLAQIEEGVASAVRELEASVSTRSTGAQPRAADQSSTGVGTSLLRDELNAREQTYRRAPASLEQRADDDADISELGDTKSADE
jgi:hypothetical protein